ncbi:hypothetical protein L1887_52810 [Cichorium endivia]|nr:hypothetical protein L1887_52810 [Cichorium endivia]
MDESKQAKQSRKDKRKQKLQKQLDDQIAEMTLNSENLDSTFTSPPRPRRQPAWSRTQSRHRASVLALRQRTDRKNDDNQDRVNEIYEELNLMKADSAEVVAGRMRVSLARALFMEPTLLLLDESVQEDERAKEERFQKEFEKQEKRIKELKSKGKSKKQAEQEVKEQQSRKQGEAQVGNLLQKHRDYVVKFKFTEPDLLSPPILGLYDVYFSYHGEVEKSKWLFENINFGVDMSSRIAIVGRTV